MTSKLITFRNLVAAGMLCLVTASCSDEGDADNRLPDGVYPMTFTAAVDGLTATRATTDNNSQWAGNEAVNIQVGRDSKTYTAASNGALTCTGGFYWQNKNSVNVTAWYPVNFCLDNITKQDEGTNYAQLDFLYSPSKEVSFNTTASLNFEHRMAKVTVTLQAGGGLADSDLNGATVKFYGYTTATVDCAAGTITSPDKNGWITPNQSGSSYSALLIPQSPFPGGEKFISVTIGSDIYYYIPQSGDADTEAGKAYNYTITVHKSGIVVSAEGWQSMGEVTGTNDTNPSYTITLTADNLTDINFTNTTKGAATGSNQPFQYAFDATENPVLTFKTGSGYEVTGVQIAGIVTDKFECIYENDTYTYQYTLSDVHSDVRIDVATVSYTQPTTPQVGDYLYTDATFSHETLFLKTCAGVFYTDSKVVALDDAGKLSTENGLRVDEVKSIASSYRLKVKNKSWYAPSTGDCGTFYTAYNSYSSVIRASLERVGGSVPGEIWTTNTWNLVLYSYNCQTGNTSGTSDTRIHDIRSFLNYSN